MPQTPKAICQAPEQYQWEMDDNCFSLENHINSARASQKQNPVALTLKNLGSAHRGAIGM